MDKGKRITVVGNQLQLPEDVIQHIQSFLSRKEAASTAILSKLWYNSWLTRPILDFDERDFQNFPQSTDRFLNFVKSSIDRYHESKLHIESFKLRINVLHIDSCSIATELISEALKLGANDINLEYDSPTSMCCLPKNLFEAESLVRLSVVLCSISDLEVRCSRLKSLCLRHVFISDVMVRDILLGCPLLENLFLSDCHGLMKVNVGRILKLNTLSVTTQIGGPRGSRIPLVEFEDQSVGSIIGCRPNFTELSCLILDKVKIDEMFFCDFSSKFPCIKDLTVNNCDACERFYISSHSLKYISLADTTKLDIQLDVPNIRKFKFSGKLIPSLSIMTASREWESYIAFSCWTDIWISWFHELKRLVKILSLSKITLSIHLESVTYIDFVPDIQDFTEPVVVDNLILEGYPSDPFCSDLWDGIFWSFQPNIITLCSSHVWYECGPSFLIGSSELLRFLRKKLMDLKSLSCWNSKQKLIGWHELEEANAEFSQDMQVPWQSVLGQTLSMGMHLEKQSPNNEVDFRFLLRWGEPDGTGPSHGQPI